MKLCRPVQAGLALVLLATAAGLSGCASTSLKGTPFYTGEYEKRVGPAEDRVNLWPLLYYRNPALSVLWPIFELTDDHAAVRPLYSVYRRQEERKEFNVLWPLAQFDRYHEDNRIFPVYWGNDYAAVFPLYWHFDEPYAEHGNGHDTLFPLWIYTHDIRDNYSLHLLWPLYNRKHDGATQGWRLWPLYADWRLGGDRYYGWYAWPLGWRWGDSDTHSRLLLPLFYQDNEPRSSTFVTLLGGRHHESDGDGFWYALPALAWGSRAGATRSTWIGGPLYHSAQSPDSSSSYLFPLYLRKNTPSSSLFLSLLAGRQHETDGDGFWYALPALAWGSRNGETRSAWIGGPLYHSAQSPGSSLTSLFPLYYRHDTADSSTLVTPLFGRHQDPEQSWHYVAPLWLTRTNSHTADAWYSLLGGRRQETNGDSFWYLSPTLTWSWNQGDASELLVGGPLFHSYRTPDSIATHLFPFYYYTRDRDNLFQLSLPWSRVRSSTKSWNLVPPFWFDYEDQAGAFTVTPLYLQGRDKRNSETWSSILPIYYHRNREIGDTFLSPLYNVWSDTEGGRSTLVPPALTYYHREDKRTDLWAFAGLGHWSWGEPAGSSYLLPLYYRNASSGSLFSPLYCAWSNTVSDGDNAFLPPALTYYRRTPDRADLWALAGLGHWSWGDKAGSSYLLPLYYRNGASGTMLSPFYCAWTNDLRGSRMTLLPPLLSWAHHDSANISFFTLLGIGKFNWGPEPESSYLLPFYYRNPVSGSWLSLPYARWKEDDRTSSAIPLLLSWFSQERNERDLRLLLGLYGRSWSTEPDTESSSWLFPIYASGKDHLLTLPAGRWKGGDTTFTYFPTPLVGWRSGATRGSWVLPFYWYRRDAETGERHLWYFPWGGSHAYGQHSESALFPLYGYENDGSAEESNDPAEMRLERGRDWNVLYLAAYSNKREPLWQYDRNAKSNLCLGVSWTAYNRLFPLWSYTRTLRSDTQRLDKEFSLLFFLQDYWRKADLGESSKEDYIRTRILWRFLHYERDHDTVSLDLFPAITYDRDGAAKRKVSFLWRGFRYERKEGRKAVDLLFLPVWRTAWVE